MAHQYGEGFKTQPLYTYNFDTGQITEKLVQIAIPTPGRNGYVILQPADETLPTDQKAK